MLGSTVSTLNLRLTNTGNKPLENISMSETTDQPDVKVWPFPKLEKLEPNEVVESQISMQFASVTATIKFDIT